MITPDLQLDLRGTPCPINFVKTKLKLERMAAGQVLEVWLDPGEPVHGGLHH
jgi:TusA-related sulfurtransferase